MSRRRKTQRFFSGDRDGVRESGAGRDVRRIRRNPSRRHIHSTCRRNRSRRARSSAAHKRRESGCIDSIHLGHDNAYVHGNACSDVRRQVGRSQVCWSKPVAMGIARHLVKRHRQGYSPTAHQSRKLWPPMRRADNQLRLISDPFGHCRSSVNLPLNN